MISTDAAAIFKPDPRTYELVEQRLGVRPDEVVFVSSNGFDVSGAKSFGFHVVRIERVTPDALRQELMANGVIGPATLFRALRTQTEGFGFGPDALIGSLRELPALASRL